MTMANGAFGPFLRDMGNNDKAFDLGADTHNIVLVTNAATPDFNAWDEYADITNEVSGGTWPAGGVALGSPTWTIASGFSTFDGADVNQAGTTLVNLRGMILVDDTLSGDPLTIGMTFGADYTTSIGPLGITWDPLGIWRIDYIP